MVKIQFTFISTFFLFVMLLSSSPLLAFTTLQSQVDKNPVLAGEAITLTVTADARLNANDLDYQQLSTWFNVMAPSVSQSTQIVNGQRTQSTRWSFTLFPLQPRNVTIPAFEINGIRSLPIELTIVAQTASPNTPRELFVDATLVGSTNVFVQQMLYYDVVIYFSGDLQRGNLTEPQLEGAEIQRVGQDVEGNDLVDGVRYRTITRRYSITPQRSGTVTITPPLFTGDMIERDVGNYNYFARSKTVMAEAPPITLEVKPQPAEFAGSWLVAGLVTLTEEWQPELSTLTVGEPITRIITLSAVDVAGSQLPDLTPQYPSQLRLYQEQPQTKSAERSNRLVAQKVFTTAIIANESGDITLPEIRLPWWNSQTNQQEIAVLPQRTLRVNAATGNLPAATSESTQRTVLEATKTEYINDNPWQWNYTSTLLTLGWLFTLLGFWFILSRRTVTPPNVILSARSPFDNKRLKHACLKGDAQLAATELLAWGKQQFKQPILSLGQLCQHLEDQHFVAEVKLLEQQLYHSTPLAWQGQKLYQCWREWHAPTSAQSKDTLAPLYPH
ncbi:BatD family protein [Alishewanella tabrizica]|uniref:DUF7939 domain-containing protein n=1 Tax=Alishewanella tabrizica TaxID=671278 RepID=A0ABQ2WPZ2_9ALTE|nr:BatD family protein [Alishewanella tabrizica]GGW62435.1 hypothetical protein GCM10008111_17990 [Alishewanella tabrizica]